MNKFICKLFIKDYQNTKNPDVRESYGRLAGIVGVISNLFLCIIKIFVGIATASIAIVADGINNLSDAASSIITLIGFKLAAKPEDEKHPYGHARYEYISGLITSIVIILVGFNLAESSVEKILHPKALEISTMSIAILVIAIFVKIWQAMFNFFIGKEIDSAAIKATAQDSKNDVISTIVVLISILWTHFTGAIVDGYLGLIVAIFIILSGISLIKETSSPLLGEAPSDELVSKISEYALKHKEVLGIHDLMVHNYGPGKIFASMHIEMDAAMDPLVSHDIVDNIERELSKKLNINFVAHMDPIQLNHPILNEVRVPIMTALIDYDNIAGIHDLRCVTGPTHTNIVLDAVKKSECVHTDREITAHVNREIHKINPNYCVIINYEKDYSQLN